MSFFTCLSNNFNCNKIYKSDQDIINGLNMQIKAEETSISILKNQIDKINKTIPDKKILDAYENYPNMWNKFKPLEQVGKHIDEDGIRKIFKKHWGATLVNGAYPNKASRGNKWSNPDRNIEAHFFTGTSHYRVPMHIMKQIAKQSLISEWKYSSTNDINGPYACNDFATSFFFEFKVAPLGYHQAVIAVLGVSNHRINAFIPAEEDKIYYFEPQTDKMWLPDLDPSSNEKKPSHLIF